jgi:hypothetical protein
VSDDFSANLDKIDAVIAAARARKAAGEAPSGAVVATDVVEKTPRISAEERLAKKAEIENDRSRRRAERAEKSAQKQVHMKKIDNARSKLPQLSSYSQTVFDELIVNLPAEQLTALALHLQHHNRLKATQRAVSTTIELGHEVKIIGGDPKFIGKVGTITEVRRIRCFVSVPGVKKPVYCFTSDVEVIPALANTGTDG